MRFGSVLCLPVWPFDGPSRQDGVLCGSQCEPTGLSQYPVFKVQAAADCQPILRFCPQLAAELPFGGKEIHYPLASYVSTGFREFFLTHPAT